MSPRNLSAPLFLYMQKAGFLMTCFIMILSYRTDRSRQKVKAAIRLLRERGSLVFAIPFATFYVSIFIKLKFYKYSAQRGGILLSFSKNKGADQLSSYCAADLRLFLHVQKNGFLMTRLILKNILAKYRRTYFEQCIYKNPYKS